MSLTDFCPETNGLKRNSTDVMRIALIKRRYSLRVGGSERYCVNLARELMERKHHVTVIGESIDTELAGEVDFIPVPVNRWTSWTSNRSFARNAAAAARSRPFDIVYGLGRVFGADAVRVTERLQAHWIRVRYRPGWYGRLQHRNPRHRTLIDLERSIYRSPDVRRVVTQSRFDRDLLIRYYDIPPGKIRVIPNGVDTDRFHPRVRAAADAIRQRRGIPLSAPLLLFASMDFHGKGLSPLLRALSQVRLPDVHLLILGDGPVRCFARQARRLGVRGRVLFAGRQADIADYYGAADLFVLPTAYEPFPNVNLEALACGTPVLTTQTNGSADLIRPGENGYLVSEMSAVEEMQHWIEHHFSLPSDRRRQMADSCRATAERYPLSRNIQSTLFLFEEIVRDTVRFRKVG